MILRRDLFFTTSGEWLAGVVPVLITGCHSAEAIFYFGGEGPGISISADGSKNAVV
jgi:hypothetical protein